MDDYWFESELVNIASKKEFREICYCMYWIKSHPLQPTVLVLICVYMCFFICLKLNNRPFLSSCALRLGIGLFAEPNLPFYPANYFICDEIGHLWNYFSRLNRNVIYNNLCILNSSVSWKRGLINNLFFHTQKRNPREV